MGNGYERHLRAGGGYLVARSFGEVFREDWFDPGFWGDRASPVTTGGRGSAWFIRSEAGNLVLRHFCRGGIPGRFIRSDYVFTSRDAVRSFAEFRLLYELFHEGFPVPEPVAAGFSRRALLLYRAALIVRRIPDARPLSDFTDVTQKNTWHEAGVCVRRFHDAGVYHADLNCMNILIADQVYLIDFDRSRVIPASGKESWKAANISRLERSVNKLLVGVEPGSREALWQAFLDGYNRTNQ